MSVAVVHNTAVEGRRALASGLTQARVLGTDLVVLHAFSGSPDPASEAKESAAVRDAVVAGLAEIVAEETGLPTDAVALEKSFTDDLDIDSLSMMTIVTHAEDKFGVRIPDDEVKNLTTVGDAVSFITGAQA